MPRSESLCLGKGVLGLRAGSGGEGAKFWMSVLTDLKNRGVTDTFVLVCDGLKGLPEVVSNVWPLATVQTCITQTTFADRWPAAETYPNETAENTATETDPIRVLESRQRPSKRNLLRTGKHSCADTNHRG